MPVFDRLIVAPGVACFILYPGLLGKTVWTAGNGLGREFPGESPGRGFDENQFVKYPSLLSSVLRQYHHLIYLKEVIAVKRSRQQQYSREDNSFHHCGSGEPLVVVPQLCGVDQFSSSLPDSTTVGPMSRNMIIRQDANRA